MDSLLNSLGAISNARCKSQFSSRTKPHRMTQIDYTLSFKFPNTQLCPAKKGIQSKNRKQNNQSAMGASGLGEDRSYLVKIGEVLPTDGRPPKLSLSPLSLAQKRKVVCLLSGAVEKHDQLASSCIVIPSLSFLPKHLTGHPERPRAAIDNTPHICSCQIVSLQLWISHLALPSTSTTFTRSCLKRASNHGVFHGLCSVSALKPATWSG